MVIRFSRDNMSMHVHMSAIKEPAIAWNDVGSGRLASNTRCEDEYGLHVSKKALHGETFTTKMQL